MVDNDSGARVFVSSVCLKGSRAREPCHIDQWLWRTSFHKTPLAPLFMMPWVCFHSGSHPTLRYTPYPVSRLVLCRPALDAPFLRSFDCIHSLCARSLQHLVSIVTFRDEDLRSKYCALRRNGRRAWRHQKSSFSSVRAVDDALVWADCFRYC